MRIVGGEFGGRRLSVPGKGDPAAHLRPTSDRVRESLFSILQGGRLGDVVTGANVLDLFAGTGALSFEALSRGAFTATLVDSGRAAQALIRENARLLGVEDRVSLVPRDVRRGPAGTAQPHGLVFLDPPYGKALGAGALDAMRAWIAPGAVVVWEDNAPQSAPEGFTTLDQRRYGDTHITFLEAHE